MDQVKQLKTQMVVIVVLQIVLVVMMPVIIVKVNLGKMDMVMTVKIMQIMIGCVVMRLILTGVTLMIIVVDLLPKKHVVA